MRHTTTSAILVRILRFLSNKMSFIYMVLTV